MTAAAPAVGFVNTLTAPRLDPFSENSAANQTPLRERWLSAGLH